MCPFANSGRKKESFSTKMLRMTLPRLKQKALTAEVAKAIKATAKFFAKRRNVPARRVVSIADIHGDNDKLLAVLAGCGLIDPVTLKWSAQPTTTLVQTGDLIDRGLQDVEVMETMMRLQQEAAKKGSKVVTLLGNHELMNLQDDLRYLSGVSQQKLGGIDK